ELAAELLEAAGDPARDRPGRDVERGADRPVALVAREEPVEDLAAALADPGEGVVDEERLVEPLDRLVDRALLELRAVCRLLAPSGPQPVDAHAPRQLCEPRADRSVVAQTREVLVRAGEDLLEYVLRIVLRQPKGLDSDRVDVPGEALDERPPGVVVAVAAAGHELRVAEGLAHRPSSRRIRMVATSRKPSRRRIGSDIAPAWVTSAGIPQTSNAISCAVMYSSSVSTRRATTPAGGRGGSSVSTIPTATGSSAKGTRPSRSSRSTRSGGVAESATSQVAAARSRSRTRARTSSTVASTSSGRIRKRCATVPVGSGLRPSQSTKRSVSTSSSPG